MSLDQNTLVRAAERLEEAERTRVACRQFSLDYPDMTIDDAYAIQHAWMQLKLRNGRTVKGHKIGLTCMNEGTIRDWVHHAKFNVTQGKNWNASGAIGPWIVTADEFPNGYDALRVQTRVNGEPRQNDSTANLMFDFAYLVGYLSTFTTLEPGDIIATGTPIGAGIRFDPPKFLQPGDVVEVEVSGVGVLRNVVKAEEAGEVAA